MRPPGWGYGTDEAAEGRDAFLEKRRPRFGPSSPGTISSPTPPVTRFQAWKTAARPHTLWASVAPVTVGTGLAIGDGVFRWDAFWMTLIVGVAIQVAANFANDVSDRRPKRRHPGPDRPAPNGGRGA